MLLSMLRRAPEAVAVAERVVTFVFACKRPDSKRLCCRDEDPRLAPTVPFQRWLDGAVVPIAVDFVVSTLFCIIS